MFLVFEGQVTGRSKNPWKDKFFYGVTLSDGEQSVKLDCTQELYERVPAITLKQGSYTCPVTFREFQGKTSLTVLDVLPAKPTK